MSCILDRTGLLSRAAFVTALLAFVLFGNVLSAQAEHTNDHRYFIQGTVKDKSGKPWVGQTVTISDPAAGITEKAKTDGKGFYEIQLHLHDSNLDDEITVTAAGETGKHIVKLTPGDVSKERRGTVNLKTDKVAEGSASPIGSALPYIVLVGIAGAIGGIIYATYPRKNKNKGGSKAPNNVTHIGAKRKNKGKKKK